MKKRKPRTTGSNLRFEQSHQFGTEYGFRGENDIAYPKLLKRLKEGLCLGCGKKQCQCKSKGNV